VPKGIPVAGALLLLVILQVALGIFGHEVALSGLLHGVNALIIFAGAMQAGRMAGRTSKAKQTQATAAARV